MKLLRVKILFFIILFSLITGNLFSQRLLKVSLFRNGNESFVSSINRSGITYVSSRELALALGASYYFNNKASKIEIKFPNYKLKFTGRNQFVIFTSKKNNSSQIFQIPISTLLLKKDVFIPINYCSKILSLASEHKIIFNRLYKKITFTTKKLNTSEIINYDLETPHRTISNYDIYGISIEEKANGTLIRFKASRRFLKPSGSIRNNKLYLFFSGITIPAGLINSIKPKGLVAGIKSKIVKGNPQFTVKLKPGYRSYDISKDADSDDILVSIQNNFLADVEKNKEISNKWKFNAIVIDPGHGGKDPGAIGVNNVKEKDVNLGIALKLGKLIKEKLKGIKVVFTRKTDKFVELYKRGKIANENNGNLFISIHANSLKRKPSETRGFEVYLLRPGRTEEAIEIASVENSVIKYEKDPKRYKKLNDENFILVSMAHSSYMRFSETFSDLLNNSWSHYVSIPSRGIKQAGFYVLVGASMPSVLIETGFLSNRKDEKYLTSKNGQENIAKAILSAILKYKKFYESSIGN